MQVASLPRRALPVLAALLLMLSAPAALAAEPDWARVSGWWGLPFVGLLLSIALMPLLAGRIWHHYYGTITAGWSLLFLVPFAWVWGSAAAGEELAHVMVQEYIPFITLLLALYTVGGGILLRGTLVGTPLVNTLILAIGTGAASLMGTTGAAMVLIRPMMRANAFRERKMHTFVFFIFLVANIGGCLTPLGDPPLYLGFLKGVPFFWPTTHLFAEFLTCAGILLALYYVIDRAAWAKERPRAPEGPAERLVLDGLVNVPLLLGVVATVLMQGIWQPGDMTILGQQVGIERVVAVVLFLVITRASMRLTRRAVREENGFTWGAIVEVGKLFAGIFVTMAPVLAILRAGREGALGGVVSMVASPDGTPIPEAYFWLTGLLSSFLDNAPTYLVFFNMAGGDPAWLTGQGAHVLAAISCGAVFMGANSYIGNAPNFMVKAIVEEQDIRMPSFFGYCGWAAVFLLPLFLLLTPVFFGS